MKLNIVFLSTLHFYFLYIDKGSKLKRVEGFHFNTVCDEFFEIKSIT
jgi:hypothetical protein